MLRIINHYKPTENGIPPQTDLSITKYKEKIAPKGGKKSKTKHSEPIFDVYKHRKYRICVNTDDCGHEMYSV